MHTYYFHIVRKGEFIPDEEGTRLPSLDAARHEAEASARDIARQAIADGARPMDLCVEIHDRQGNVLAALSIAEIMEHPQAPDFERSCKDAERSGTLH